MLQRVRKGRQSEEMEDWFNKQLNRSDEYRFDKTRKGDCENAVFLKEVRE